MVHDPWRLVAVHAIGGLTEVGFLSSGSRLLVVSHQGRGEFDLATGERVARDGNEDSAGWFDDAGPSCMAVSCQEWVPVAGLAGGSLPLESGAWRVVAGSNEAVAVHSDGVRQLLSAGEEVKVAGFGPGGHVLVVGCSPEVYIFAL